MRLLGSGWNGKEVLVSDGSLRLSYCLLPMSVGRHICKVKIDFEEEQGSCGRGLVILESACAGDILFESRPL